MGENGQGTIVPRFVFTAREDNVLNMVTKQLIRQSSATEVTSEVVKKWTYSVVTGQSPEPRSALEMHDSNELNTEIRVHRRQNTSWLETVLDQGVD